MSQGDTDEAVARERPFPGVEHWEHVPNRNGVLGVWMHQSAWNKIVRSFQGAHAAGRREEREACAQIAETIAGTYRLDASWVSANKQDLANEIAAAIRARARQDEEE